MGKLLVTIGVVFTFILNLLSLSSCKNNQVYWKEGPYVVTDNSVIPNCRTLYHVDHGRLDHVKRIGSNERYIIIETDEVNSEYWFIDKTKDRHLMNAHEIVEGPYDIGAFNAIKIQKGVAKLDFKEEFE